jgi:hypothetical protein
MGTQELEIEIFNLELMLIELEEKLFQWFVHLSRLVRGVSKVK